jgi:hypothetical protein
LAGFSRPFLLVPETARWTDQSIAMVECNTKGSIMIGKIIITHSVGPALATIVLLAGSGIASAQQKAAVPAKPGAARTVLLFDKLCYEMVPNFAGLEAHANKMKWSAITGQRLQGFKPAAPPKVLKAWSLTDLGAKFMIAISQSDMDAQGKKDFPAFADAQSYSCSLVLPAKWPRADMAAAMQKLMGRKPDEQSEQGRLIFSSWGGVDKTRRVIINHMGMKTGGPGGLLSVTLMLKK